MRPDADPPVRPEERAAMARFPRAARTAALTILMLLTLLPGGVGGQVDRERQRIEFLLSAVEGLEGATFLRNGSAHTGKEAAAHLRLKLRRAGERVHTAEDFIRICASKSYLTGQPYLIRFADGRTIPADEFLRRLLEEYPTAGRARALSLVPHRTVPTHQMEAFWLQGMQAGHRNALECIRAFSETDFTKDLETIDVPTLILHGDDDQIVPIKASAHRSSKLVRNATLKIHAGGAHSLADTRKDELNTDLLEFLKEEPE